MEDNGKEPEKISGVVQEIRGRIQQAKAGVLLCMSEKYPKLRLFFVGGEQGDGIAPAGTAAIQTGPYGVTVILRIPALGVEARYDLVEWATMWEIIEKDMQENAVPWCEDWNQKKKERARYSDLV